VLALPERGAIFFARGRRDAAPRHARRHWASLIRSGGWARLGQVDQGKQRSRSSEPQGECNEPINSP